MPAKTRKAELRPVAKKAAKWWKPTPKNDMRLITVTAWRAHYQRVNNLPEPKGSIERDLSEYVELMRKALAGGFANYANRVRTDIHRLKEQIADLEREEALERRGLTAAYKLAKREAAGRA